MRFVSLFLLLLICACAEKEVKPIFEADTLGVRTQRLENSLNSKYDVIMNMLSSQNSRLAFASEHSAWLKQRDESCNRLFSSANQYACVYELTLFRTSYYTDFINKLSRNRFADIYFNPYFKEQQNNNTNVKKDAPVTQTYTPDSIASKTDTPEDEPAKVEANTEASVETTTEQNKTEDAKAEVSEATTAEKPTTETITETETKAESATTATSEEKTSPTDTPVTNNDKATTSDNKEATPEIVEDAPQISASPSATVDQAPSAATAVAPATTEQTTPKEEGPAEPKTITDAPSNLIGEPLKNEVPNIPAPATEAEKI